MTGAPTDADGSGAGTVWAVVPARYESTRFPGKPLAMLAGKPMIQHVCERTARTPSVARVLVATDDARIQAAVEAFGGQAVMTGEHPTGTDRIAEAVEIESRRAGAPGWVLNVQGDEPLLDPAGIDAAVDALLSDPGLPISTVSVQIKSEEEMLLPSVVKVVTDQSGDALYFSRALIPHTRLADSAAARECAAATVARGLARKHVGLYAYRREALLRIGFDDRMGPGGIRHSSALPERRETRN